MPVLQEAVTTYDKAQRVLIGHLLLFPSTAPDVFAVLRGGQSAAFGVSILRHIFEAMARIYGRGVEISQEVVIAEVGAAGNPTTSLPTIFAQCIDSAHREYLVQELGAEISDYVRELLDGHHYRTIRERMQRATSYSELVRVAEEAIVLDTGNRTGHQRPVTEIVDELIDIQTNIREGRRRAGYSWGVSALDDAILIRPGKLYTVAGQKGAGKTKFLLSIIDKNLSLREGPVPCLLFSLEMNDVEVIKYLSSRRAEVDSSLIFSRALPNELFDDVKLEAEALRRAPLEVDGSPCLTVREIISRIRHWKIKNRVPEDTGIVGIDFLQLVTLDRRYGQLSEATALKNVAYRLAEAAKRLGVSIVAVAQLNKQGDGKRPEIGFIEGSGGLAQASQGVLLLDLVRLREDGQEDSEDGQDEMNVIVAKNRDGESMVTVPCRADLSIGRFFGPEPRTPWLIK